MISQALNHFPDHCILLNYKNTNYQSLTKLQTFKIIVWLTQQYLITQILIKKNEWNDINKARHIQNYIPSEKKTHQQGIPLNFTETSEYLSHSSDGIKNFQSQKGNFICHSCNTNLTTLISRKCQHEEGSPSMLLW